MGTLTPRKVKAISNLLLYPTFEKVAAETGINKRTLSRWMIEPEFRAALHKAQGEAYLEVGRKFLNLADFALSALVDVVKNPQQDGAGNKRLAASSLLDQLAKLNDRHITDERIIALEEKVGNGNFKR